MAMRKSTRNELRKLRELVALLLSSKKCCFCKKPLITLPDGWGPGEGDAPKFDTALTVHHRNGDHDDNTPGNHRLCHRSCHRSHHMRKQRKAGVT